MLLSSYELTNRHRQDEAGGGGGGGNYSTQLNTGSLPFCHLRLQRKSSAVILLHKQSLAVRAMLIKICIQTCHQFKQGRVFFWFNVYKTNQLRRTVYDIDVMEAAAIFLIGY